MIAEYLFEIQSTGIPTRRLEDSQSRKPIVAARRSMPKAVTI